MNMASVKGSTYLKSSLQAIPLVSGKINFRQSRVIEQQKGSAPTVVANSNRVNQSWYKNPKIIGAIATVGTLITVFAIAYKKGMIPWPATPVTGRNDIYSVSRGVFGHPMSYPSDKPAAPAPIVPGSREHLEQVRARRNKIHNTN